MIWARHVAHTREKGKAFQVSKGKPEGKGPLGRPNHRGKSKGILQQAEVALGVPGRLRPRIFSTFGTTRVVFRQPKAPAAFTPGEIPGTHFQRLS